MANADHVRHVCADPAAAAALIALADPIRMKLVEQLAEGPSSVRKLAEGFTISRAAVSQHLKILLKLGLVSYRKHGPLNIYSLDPEPLGMLQAYVTSLNRSARDSAERWRRQALWFERI